MECNITKRIRGGDAYYTINWSPLEEINKYRIMSSVPSMSGIFELYYLDESKTLNIFCLSRAWYGGIRNTVREMCDPISLRYPEYRSFFSEHPVILRYALSDSFQDMADILYFFFSSGVLQTRESEASGRYGDIYVKEQSRDKLVTIRNSEAS